MSGLNGISSEGLGGTAAARRAALLALPDDELSARLVACCRALTPVDAGPLARFAGLPVGEVLASPFALRAVALGVEVGAALRHRELRRLAMSDADRRVADAAHDVWDRGVLGTGKYQGFRADAPFGLYEPAHVAKWGPHELLHRAAGFFFRRGASRFEHYLGARLNELVPVVAFYGPEQALRLDEERFDRAAAGRAPRASVERARWRLEGDAELSARARRHAAVLREGVAHFERELSAIDEELVTRRRVRVRHETPERRVLDASSDATAYVVGHMERLSSEPVARVLSALPGSIACPCIDEYRDRVEALFDRLLFSALTVDLEAAASARDVRETWDLLWRAAHLDPAPAPGAPWGDDARVAEALRLPAAEARRAVSDAIADDALAEWALADGSTEGRALDQLYDGLSSVAPVTLALFEADEALPDPVMGLGDLASLEPSSAAAPAGPPSTQHAPPLLERGDLGGRLQSWLERADVPASIVDMARLEVAIARARPDDAVEHLAEPAPADGAFLMRSVSTITLTLGHDAVGAHARFAETGSAERPEPRPQTVVVAHHAGGVSLLPVPAPVFALLARLEDRSLPEPEARAVLDQGGSGARTSDDATDWIAELLRAGVVARVG